MRIESALAHIPEPQQTEVKKILYGINNGQLVAPMPVAEKAKALAGEHNFEVAAYQFSAAKEQLRQPRQVYLEYVLIGMTWATIIIIFYNTIILSNNNTRNCHLQSLLELFVLV
jgi:hypothetical protein